MKHIALTIAAVSALAFSAPVLAADLPSAPPVIEDFEEEASLSGLYIGGFVESLNGDVFSGGVELGYDFTPAENFLLGIEGSILANDAAVVGWVKGKAGFTVDQFAIYGFGAVGTVFGGGGPISKVGLGAELKLDENWGINGEIASIDVGGLSPFGTGDYVAQIGVRYHF